MPSGSEVWFQIAHNGPCPYLDGGEWIAYCLYTRNTAPAIYESLINSGFRRNGFSIYKNICPNCDACLPVKVDAANFKPSKSQRRVLKKNRDVIVRRHPTCFDAEGFLLYRKYCHLRHGHIPREEEYSAFLIESPVPGEMMRYYLGRRLVGVGWIDVLPDSLSSVYFAYDPDFSARSLGVFSVMKEIELCAATGKSWLQLGFWVGRNRKMSYKNRYRPCYLLVDNKWRPAGNRPP